MSSVGEGAAVVWLWSATHGLTCWNTWSPAVVLEGHNPFRECSLEGGVGHWGWVSGFRCVPFLVSLHFMPKRGSVCRQLWASVPRPTMDCVPWNCKQNQPLLLCVSLFLEIFEITVGVPVCVCGYHKGQEEVLKPLGDRVLVFVSCLMWVPGSELWSSDSSKYSWLLSPLLKWLFFLKEIIVSAWVSVSDSWELEL